MAAKYSDHDSDDEYDEDIGMWVGNPLKHGDYDNEGNYKEKEEKKEEKKASPLAALKHSEPVKSESRNEKYKRLMREKADREKAARKSAPKRDVGKGVSKSIRKRASRAKQSKRKRSAKRRTIRRK